MKLHLSFTALAISTLLLAGCQTTQTLPPPAVHGEHAHPHKHQAHWGYQSPNILPANWGDEEVNKLCKIGQTQSPINIEKVQKPATGKFDLVRNYQSQDFTVTNNGHTIVFTAKNPATSKLTLNGKDYHLLQFHYHIPSEHTVMNANYPLEIHFVHKNAENQIAVIGVLVNKGVNNSELQKILNDLPMKQSDEGALKAFNVATIMPTSSNVYAYDGSLTTPPCSEQVHWLLNATPITASEKQINQLAKLYTGNNRPALPQGSRPVYLLEK